LVADGRGDFGDVGDDCGGGEEGLVSVCCLGKAGMTTGCGEAGAVDERAGG